MGKAAPITLNIRWVDEKDVPADVRRRLEVHGRILKREVGKIVSDMIDEAKQKNLTKGMKNEKLR